MNVMSMRLFVVALVTAVLTASCGGGQGESVAVQTGATGATGAASRAEEFPEPPSSFERLDPALRPDTIEWIRTTGDRGDRILYYANVVDSYGEKREITVSVALTITENSATQEKSYRWREVHRKIDVQNRSISTIKTDEGSGTVATEVATTPKYGPVTVYRLKGTKPAEKFRTWVDFDRELVLPAPKIEESHALGASVLWHARATPHVLEVSKFADEKDGYKLGLKRGDALIIRLQRGLKYRAAVLQDGTQATPVVLTNTTTEPAFRPEDVIDVYHFTARAPGWVDLKFDLAVGTFRVRVE